MTETIFRQTIIMLMLIMVGFLCSRSGLISKSTNKELSGLVLQVVNPIVIFMSYQREYQSELAKDLGLTFLISAGAFAAAIGISMLLIRRRNGRDTEVERFSAVYSNCGFMGIPLVNALFGMEGVFFLTAFITVFNLTVWTHGVILISGERDMRRVVKVFYSPTMIAIALGLISFFLRLRLPSVPSEALEQIAGLNTPLAMIVSGVTIADTKVKDLLTKPGVYYTVFLRLFVIPLVIAFALAPMSINDKVRMTVVVASAAPPAAMCTLQCVKYGKNSLYASEIFAFGTILSVATLPAVVRLAERLTNLID
jgi:hypothetical protein